MPYIAVYTVIAVAMVVLTSIWPSTITNSPSLSSNSVKIKLERGLKFVSSAFRSSSVNTPHAIAIDNVYHDKDALSNDESLKSRRLQTEVHDSGLGNSQLECYLTIVSLLSIVLLIYIDINTNELHCDAYIILILSNTITMCYFVHF